MSKSRITLEISKWEFLRWFKWKDQILTIVISTGIGLAMWGGKVILDKNRAEKAKVIVLNTDLFSPLAAPGLLVELVPAEGESEQELREAVGKREIDGLLVLKNIDEAELVVYKEPLWKSEIEEYFTRERRQRKMETLGLAPGLLMDVLMPFTVKLTLHEAGVQGVTLAEKITAGFLVGLMLIGVFYSVSLQFVAITGEKQLRVTEVIVSAITPQQWIDGKILGISAFSFVRTINFVISILVFIAISSFFGVNLAVPLAVKNPVILFLLLISSVGGFFFWNTFFAAIAATINDPNTSSKSALLFLPFIPAMSFPLAALIDPDSTLTQVMTILPITSPTALSARLVLTEVPAIEVILALALLAISIWFMRKVAGKIFHLGILMYGKEPTVREMLHWVRET